jgi:hypothetical protein
MRLGQDYAGGTDMPYPWGSLDSIYYSTYGDSMCGADGTSNRLIVFTQVINRNQTKPRQYHEEGDEGSKDPGRVQVAFGTARRYRQGASYGHDERGADGTLEHVEADIRELHRGHRYALSLG